MFLCASAVSEGGAFVETHGRRIAVGGQSCPPRAAVFSFEELCGGGGATPMSAVDYLAIAAAFENVLLCGVPILQRADRDAIRRLVTLIDILYDQKVCGGPAARRAATAPPNATRPSDGADRPLHPRGRRPSQGLLLPALPGRARLASCGAAGGHTPRPCRRASHAHRRACKGAIPACLPWMGTLSREGAQCSCRGSRRPRRGANGAPSRSRRR